MKQRDRGGEEGKSEVVHVPTPSETRYAHEAYADDEPAPGDIEMESKAAQASLDAEMGFIGFVGFLVPHARRRDRRDVASAAWSGALLRPQMKTSSAEVHRLTSVQPAAHYE